MSTRDDLIAARALIDTPEKWSRMKGVVVTVGEATQDAPARVAAIRAIRRVGITGREPHALLMTLFDRAIASLPNPTDPS